MKFKVYIKFALFLDFNKAEKLFLKLFSQSYALKSPEDAGII